jgi:hypothetical protein
LLAPILNDSYETLLSDKIRRIKECSNCDGFFMTSLKTATPVVQHANLGQQCKSAGLVLQAEKITKPKLLILTHTAL